MCVGQVIPRGGGGGGQGSPFPLLCYTIEEAVDRDWPQETSGPVTLIAEQVVVRLGWVVGVARDSNLMCNLHTVREDDWISLDG